MPTSENHCQNHMAMRRRWTEERRQNRIQADWIVGWLRDNGPATIREIVEALQEAGRDVKAHIIRRALQKSQFTEKTGEVEINGDIHSLYSFSVSDNAE
tara:strand:+ start:145 stop:441 length:297 start_codon:yes stop_codon:yes gene_type:complete